jgi:hypothetical protein
MDTVEECRTHAEKCRELANSMTTPVDQQIFDWMAQAWEKLADLRKLDREPEPESSSLCVVRAWRASAQYERRPLRAARLHKADFPPPLGYQILTENPSYCGVEGRIGPFAP